MLKLLFRRGFWYEVGCGVNPTTVFTPVLLLLPLASSSLVLCSLPRVHLFFIYFNSYASVYLRSYQDNYICLFFGFTIKMERKLLIMLSVVTLKCTNSV